jgi:hypothetical protein
MRILLLPLIAAAAVAAMAWVIGPADAAGQTEQAQSSEDSPPMHFAIVRSDEAGCEPNCPQWISAEGAITPETPASLRKILKQMGKTRLPILITSSGGDIDAAIAMGEIVRAQKLDVGVGWTLFSGCWPGDETCLIPGQQKGIYHGTPVTWRAYCISACSFILAGGRKRLAAGTTLGVTSFSRTVSTQRVFYQERYQVVNGKKKILGRTIVKKGPVKNYTTSKLDKSTLRKLGSFVGKMGVAKGFLAFFTKVQAGSVYFLTSKEAFSTGLLTALDSARSLVDNHLCQMTPAAENCVKIVASAKQL